MAPPPIINTCVDIVLLIESLKYREFDLFVIALSTFAVHGCRRKSWQTNRLVLWIILKMKKSPRGSIQFLAKTSVTRSQGMIGLGLKPPAATRFGPVLKRP